MYFTIRNDGGTSDLYLTGTPVISWTNQQNFGCNNPQTTITPNSSTSFILYFTFDPVFEGNYSTTITISNNDYDENPYNFTVSMIYDDPNN